MVRVFEVIESSVMAQGIRGVVGRGGVMGHLGGVLVPVLGSLLILLGVRLVLQWIHRGVL